MTATCKICGATGVAMYKTLSPTPMSPKCANKEACDLRVTLRSLPVIRICSDCAWGAIQEGMCHHANAPQGDLDTGGHSNQAPPSWCPMRGAQ